MYVFKTFTSLKHETCQAAIDISVLYQIMIPISSVKVWHWKACISQNMSDKALVSVPTCLDRTGSNLVSPWFFFWAVVLYAFFNLWLVIYVCPNSHQSSTFYQTFLFLQGRRDDGYKAYSRASHWIRQTDWGQIVWTAYCQVSKLQASIRTRHHDMSRVEVEDYISGGSILMSYSILWAKEI